MPTSIIRVYRNNRPVSGVRVTLEYTGLAQMGFTKAVFTDGEGVAYVEHSSTGEAKIYVDGSFIKKMWTPGNEPVTI